MKCDISVDRNVLDWIAKYVDHHRYGKIYRLSISKITEKLWRDLRRAIGDDFLPAPKPYTRETNDLAGIEFDVEDEETYDWITKYCKFHGLSMSEVCERLYKKFRQDRGEHFYVSQSQATIGEAIEYRLRKSRRS